MSAAICESMSTACSDVIVVDDTCTSTAGGFLDLGDHFFIHRLDPEATGCYYDHDNDFARMVFKKLNYQHKKLQRKPSPLKTKNTSIKNYKPLPRNRLWKFRVKRPKKSFSY